MGLEVVLPTCGCPPAAANCRPPTHTQAERPIIVADPTVTRDPTQGMFDRAQLSAALSDVVDIADSDSEPTVVVDLDGAYDITMGQADGVPAYTGAERPIIVVDHAGLRDPTQWAVDCAQPIAAFPMLWILRIPTPSQLHKALVEHAVEWGQVGGRLIYCLPYTSPSPRDRTRPRMPSSA